MESELTIMPKPNQEKLPGKIRLLFTCYSPRNRKLAVIIVILLFILTWCFFSQEYQQFLKYKLLQCNNGRCSSSSDTKERIDMLVNSLDRTSPSPQPHLEYNRSEFNPSTAEFHAIGDQYIVKYNQKLAPRRCNQPAFVVFAINSAARHFNRRIGIRQTWGNAWEFQQRIRIANLWRLIFIVGRTGNIKIDRRVDEEARLFGDLVITDLIEHHHVLTEKTILGMYWARRYCQTQFYYKGDDDVWINKWRLFDYLVTLSLRPTVNPSHCWIGFVSTMNRIPIRDKSSKYYISYDNYPMDKFAPYCSGFGYFMTGQTADRLIWAIPYVQKIPGLDDVYIGLLANVTHVEPTHNDDFHIYSNNARYQNYTSYELYHTMAEHGVNDAELMISFHRSARTKYVQLMDDQIIDTT
ncbi:Beta-1,3-galactosyltransferase 1 [Trichoplax sp. H2]|nr:Beta-1,3-galactosyltransferase 1 [Trichoplax sp. H2]|eukprot:RDD45836.1 Beta-1,3-galactosyltransferase 1 [Trichoplax sp. H2]